jgi:Prion-inhibition and propagation
MLCNSNINVVREFETSYNTSSPWTQQALLSRYAVCIQGYKTFQSLMSLGTDAQVILSKIEIQEYRLQRLKQTLETIKKATNTRDLSLVIQPVYNTLESIKLLTTDAAHLRTQYKLEILCPDRDELEMLESDRPVLKVRKPYIIKWLLFDKTNMEKLARDLKTLTDGLEDLLALAVRHDLPSTLLGAAITFLATPRR